jgi:ribosomal protein S18 acetylase RimI-like enzyme
MSLYADYLRERTDKRILEDEKGFVTYYFINDGVYLEDIYVSPDYRHSGVASEMADKVAEIAKEQGCTKMFGTICPAANNSTEGLKVLLAYGFRLDSCVNNFIALKKDI